MVHNNRSGNKKMIEKLLKVKKVLANKIAYTKSKNKHVPYCLYETFFNTQVGLDLLEQSENNTKIGLSVFCYKKGISDYDVAQLIHQGLNASHKLVNALYSQ